MSQSKKMRGIFGDRDRHFGFETSRFRDYCQFFEGFGFREFVLGKSLGFGYREFGLGKKVSISENLVSEKKSRFQFWKVWCQKKSLGFGEFGPGVSGNDF